MDLNLSNLLISVPHWAIILSSLLFAFVITYTVIPSIIAVSHAKGLFDTPNKRKSHLHSIPTLGGAAVFLGMLLPTTIFGSQDFDHELKYIIAGLLILFFVGIKDDILVISPKKKFISEIFAIGLIVFLGNIRISSFHGFLGIFEIPYLLSVLFSIFVFIVIINGFNLIDGIDGLASAIGIITISTLGVWFILVKDYAYAAFSFSTVGALMAFFRYNVFSRNNKIFLGDTGSLIIGLTVSIFAVKFLEGNLIHHIGSVFESAPAIAFGVLIVPMIDTLRIFSIRLFSGKSPFTPDRNHIHHKLLDMGLTHLKATIVIVGFNLLIIALSLSLSHLGNMKLLAIILPLSIILTSIPSAILRYRDRIYLSKIGLIGDKSWIIPETVTNFSRYYVDKKLISKGDQIDKEHQKQIDLEPVLHETFLRLSGESSPIEFEEVHKIETEEAHKIEHYLD